MNENKTVDDLRGNMSCKKSCIKMALLSVNELNEDDVEILMSHFKTLHHLSMATEEELCSLKNIGEEKAILNFS